jgi:DNA modification methylase
VNDRQVGPPVTGPFVDRVFCGDCLEVMPGLPRGVFALVFCDPPFNIDYAYDVYDDARPAKEYLDWCWAWMVQAWSLLAPDGTFWLAIGPKFYPELDRLAQKLGFHRRATVVWHCSFGVNRRRNFTASHTNLAYYVKDPERFHFDKLARRVRSARQELGDRRAHPDGRLPDDVWTCNRIAGTHKARYPVATHMPEAILDRIIAICSKPGDLVLDPFLGSGVTAAVAKKLGRHYCGIELSPNYAAIAARRLEGIGVGDALEGPTIRGS